MIDIKTEEKLKPLKQTISDVDAENKLLKHYIVQLKIKIKKLKKQQSETEPISKQSLINAYHNEQYSRKNNIKIMDIREKQKETEEYLIDHRGL